MLGLAIAFAISAVVNLVLLINHRNRELILSAGRWLVRRMQAIRATPDTDSTFPGPKTSGDALKTETLQSTTPPPPPPPPPTPQPRPAIVWPTVRPSAPPPPPRVLSYGAKGIFETGKRTKHFIKNIKIGKHNIFQFLMFINSH